MATVTLWSVIDTTYFVMMSLMFHTHNNLEKLLIL